MTCNRRTFLAACAGGLITTLSLPPPRPARPPPPPTPPETWHGLTEAQWAVIAWKLELAAARQRAMREFSFRMRAVLESGGDGTWTMRPMETSR